MGGGGRSLGRPHVRGRAGDRGEAGPASAPSASRATSAPTRPSPAASTRPAAIAPLSWRPTSRIRPPLSSPCWKNGRPAPRWCGPYADAGWAKRPVTVGFSRLYYWLMRRVVGMRDNTRRRRPTSCCWTGWWIDAFRQFNETHVSILALITWMGFRQDHIVYDKQAPPARPLRLEPGEEAEAGDRFRHFVHLFAHPPDDLCGRRHRRAGPALRGLGAGECDLRKAGGRLDLAHDRGAGDGWHPDADDGSARRISVARARRIAPPPAATSSRPIRRLATGERK